MIRGRILAALMPEEPEALGLLALMELQASRLAARAEGQLAQAEVELAHSRGPLMGEPLPAARRRRVLRVRRPTAAPSWTVA